jgi:hypothetical protein
MGKRSNFARKEKDFYETPYEAVLPLIPFLGVGSTYWEPCVGEGALVRYLNRFGLRCFSSSDIEKDASRTIYPVEKFDYFITNPPWSRDILHPIIENLAGQRPTWLLFDADWMHTKQSRELIQYCQKIVSVGRLKWIPDSPYTGKDNCCWYLFGSSKSSKYGDTIFHGR